MFVQVTKCKHGSATYFTYLVRESFRKQLSKASTC
jgi:hypothetical protein